MKEFYDEQERISDADRQKMENHMRNLYTYQIMFFIKKTKIKIGDL
jgi:hypothetical protein